MPFTPTAILNDVRNGDLDKTSAIELLITIIDNSENIETRLETIKVIEKIEEKSKRLFKFLENLLISDNNEKIRIQSAKILTALYIEQAIPPINWVLQHEKSLAVQIAIIHYLADMDTEKTRSILLKKINEYHKKKYK
ncbi:MAG: HEAT repeat domain-containing protein, partial [Promethearchaeota archaeon]